MGIISKTAVEKGVKTPLKGAVKIYRTVYKSFIGKGWGNTIAKTNSEFVGREFYNIKLDKGVTVTIDNGSEIISYEGGVDNDLSFVLFPNKKRTVNKAGVAVKDGDMRLSIVQTVLE